MHRSIHELSIVIALKKYSGFSFVRTQKKQTDIQTDRQTDKWCAAIDVHSTTPWVGLQIPQSPQVSLDNIMSENSRYTMCAK